MVPKVPDLNRLILRVLNFTDCKGTAVSFPIAPADRRQVLGVLHQYYPNLVERRVLFPCGRHLQLVRVRVASAHEREPVRDQLGRERKFGWCLRCERAGSVESRDGGRVSHFCIFFKSRYRWWRRGGMQLARAPG